VCGYNCIPCVGLPVGSGRRRRAAASGGGWDRGRVLGRRDGFALVWAFLYPAVSPRRCRVHFASHSLLLGPVELWRFDRWRVWAPGDHSGMSWRGKTISIRHTQSKSARLSLSSLVHFQASCATRSTAVIPEEVSLMNSGLTAV
jgi:hypothetical protein